MLQSLLHRSLSVFAWPQHADCFGLLRPTMRSFHISSSSAPVCSCSSCQSISSLGGMQAGRSLEAKCTACSHHGPSALEPSSISSPSTSESSRKDTCSNGGVHSPLHGWTCSQVRATDSQKVSSSSSNSQLMQGPLIAYTSTTSFTSGAALSTCSGPPTLRTRIGAPAMSSSMSHAWGSVRHFARRLRRQPLPFEGEFNEDEFLEWLYDFEDLTSLEDLEKLALNDLSRDERIWELRDLVVSETGQVIQDEGEESDLDEGEH